ncbi:MAG: hypothetical protein HUU14_13250 [Dehalococcoidia bacterium]|nr:MAG: hypothetical protein EDM76_06465 [bacterium]MCE7928159.1 hypothetical protein [Chloroflexi bacterium CFX7]MCK6563585.1 hypothetical protein [Dehalococcoidia bacterium]MCL4232564.1 hypothetical protein [Dehalococcoidia bacterium]NUQ56849.1 hypothetical protein [Dehalococcoidia bacterium]
MWADLQTRYGERVELVQVDRDSKEGRKFAEEHGIYYQPGFVVVDAAGNTTYAGLGPFDAKGVTGLVQGAAGE